MRTAIPQPSVCPLATACPHLTAGGPSLACRSGVPPCLFSLFDPSLSLLTAADCRSLHEQTSDGGRELQPFSSTRFAPPQQLRVRYCVRAPDSQHSTSSLSPRQFSRSQIFRSPRPPTSVHRKAARLLPLAVACCDHAHPWPGGTLGKPHHFTPRDAPWDVCASSWTQRRTTTWRRPTAGSGYTTDRPWRLGIGHCQITWS